MEINFIRDIDIDIDMRLVNMKGRPVAVVRVVSLSHQVIGSKQPLRRFCGGKACLGLSLPHTPLMWEPPALSLPFYAFSQYLKHELLLFHYLASMCSVT